MEQLKWRLRGLRGSPLHRLAHRIVGSLRGNYDSTHFDRYLAHDRQTVEVLRRVLRPDSNGVDVGSHRGDLLQNLITLAPEGKHRAFEPLPQLADTLRTRFPQVTVHQAAVGAASGEAQFCFVENDPGYSGLRRRVYDRPDPRITRIPVTVASLDAVIPPTESVALLKLDIEGGEYDALKGAIQTIRRCQPVVLLEAGRKSTGEYGVTPDQMYELVTQTLGYELTTMERWLAQSPALTLPAFRDHWENGTEYDFLAAPTVRSPT